jgi:DNA-binding NtrC family response regulator
LDREQSTRLAIDTEWDGPRRTFPSTAPVGIRSTGLRELGAFTAASRARRGEFEVAHRGTLFLEEITEMHPARAAIVEEYEREYLRRILDRAGGRVGEAARLGGVDERTLYNKLRRYGIEKEAFRERVRCIPSPG